MTQKVNANILGHGHLNTCERGNDLQTIFSGNAEIEQYEENRYCELVQNRKWKEVNFRAGEEQKVRNQLL